MIWSVISAVLLVIVTYVTLFFVWRKVDQEHLDGIESFFDVIFKSSLVAYGAGRLGYLLFSLRFPINSITQLWSSGVTSVSIPLLIAGFFLAFYRFSIPHWKDRFHLLDLISIGMACWLSLCFLCLTIVGVRPFIGATTVSVSLVSSLLLPAVISILFGLLFVLLTQLEQVYRTFMWYRYRRSSAQSGFVVAAFLVGGGILLLARLLLFEGLKFNFSFIGELIVTLLFILSGFIILYIRSGRFKLRS